MQPSLKLRLLQTISLYVCVASAQDVSILVEHKLSGELFSPAGRVQGELPLADGKVCSQLHVRAYRSRMEGLRCWRRTARLCRLPQC